MSRRGVWAGVALLCIAAGIIASVIAARSVAHNDAAKAREAFPRTSAVIAATLKQSIAHDEDLLIGGSTFFAAKPQASAAEFNTWVKWARMLHRYPELERLGLLTLVRAPELAAFEAQIAGRKAPVAASSSAALALASPSSIRASAAPVAAPALAPTSSTATAASPSPSSLRIVPSSTHSYYCLATVELTRGVRRQTRVARDYCALTRGLLASRDSALSVYSPVRTGRNQALAIETPVYRGNVPPSGFANRRQAFVGWLREVLVPGVVVQQALRGHPEYAVRLRYRSGTSLVLVSGGVQQKGAQSRAINLHNGWTVRTFGPSPATGGVFSDGDALALLIGGVLLSSLAGLLIFVLGGGRGGSAPAPAPAPRAPQTPGEDLYDPLTGLPNRALMLDRANRMLARASRQSGLLVGALFIDIDWFKEVNEKLGPAAGDQLLKVVAERLEGVVRTHDTVGRLGGDEFVVLVESAARGARLDSLARRIIESLHKPVDVKGFGPSFSLTASIGVAFGRYATPEDLLRDARLALTAAKTAGRDRYTLFNANMRSVIEGRGVLEVELNRALQDGQFFLLYEPIYDLATRKVVGLEALLRWQHPTKGVLLPEDFIPLAEESGLIVPIGRLVLEEACSRAAAWNVAGHRMGISLKVASTQLNRDGFATDVRRALQQSGIDPSLLTLEIAETTVMRDVAVAAERLGEIKQLGVRIAIDDFGSGYAHHSDLQRMPLDFLKVDRGSLAAMDDEDYRTWLLQAILIVGRDLSLPVIATGIETHEQMTALQGMGCPMAQGPLFGSPAPADAVEGIFAAELPSSGAASAGKASSGAASSGAASSSAASSGPAS